MIAANNMKWRALLFLHLLVLTLHVVNAKHFIEFLHWDNCKASDAAGNYRLENSQFGMVAPGLCELNTTFVVGENYDIVVLKFKIYACKSMSDADCELYFSLILPDHCKKMTEKGQFYSGMAESSHPPMTCPLKKAAYHIVKAHADIETVKNLPMEENVIYKIVWIFEHHGKRIGCWVGKAKKTRLRGKKKNNNES